MSKEYTSLSVTCLKPDNCIAEYVYLPKVVHLDDNAIDALIDFQNMKPLIIDATKPMEASDLHVVLATNQKEQLLGLLSLEQILSEKPVKMMESRRVERKDMIIRSVMTPLEEVAAINIDKLTHAKVGHIVSTLQKFQRYYLLVFEDDEISGKKVIRGVFLASAMSKLLGKRINIDPARAKSIAELQTKLHK